MTRRDYVLVASALNQAYRATSNPQGKRYVEYAARYVALEMAKQNPRFSTDLFMREVIKSG